MAASILVVDDNPANLGSLEALLKDTGADIVKAHSGNQALLELLSREFALVLLDIQMPTMDGFETAQLIRSRDKTRHLPIIFLTAFHRSETNVLQGYSLGAVDFLFKPIVPEILRSKVVFFLELHAKNLEIRRQTELLHSAEKREHERNLAEQRQRYERALLQEEAERERRIAEAHRLRTEELERAQDAMRRSAQRLELLADSANRLLVAPHPELEVQTLCGDMARHLGLEAYFHYGLEEDGRLSLRGHRGLSEDVTAQFERVAMGQGLCGQVAAERSRAVVDTQHPLVIRPPSIVHAGHFAAAACFPLLAQDRLLGVLGFATRSERTFEGDELAMMQAFCDQLAVALDRARLISALQDSDRRKDEFLAMLGHELRNPLAPIRNALEVFRLRGGEDPKMQRAVKATERQVRQMVRLVDDLLDVSRITRGKVELRRERVFVADVVELAVHATESLFASRGQTLTVNLPQEPLMLDADSARLAQVLGNLLQNAAKYSDAGAKTELSVLRDAGEVVVRVRDQGIGLRPQMLNKVFDLFVQEAPASDRALGGLGIGLTLVKRLVEMHGGTVRARSEGLGHGSEFEVRLPVLQETLPAAEALESAVAADPLAPLDILLVEDNPDIRETMRDLLELQGHRVTEAGDGVAGVEKLLAEKPKLALVDIGLPGLDGYEFAERVRKAEGGLSTRLVALTGYGTADARQRAIASGFDEHLVKPISAEDLLRVLRRFAP